MINSPIYSDISLVVTDKEFYAHRCVLSSRCTYFVTMLKGPMIESTNKVVYLEDIEVETFLLAMEYIYTGTVNNLSSLSSETILDLIVLVKNNILIFLYVNFRENLF